MREVKKNIEIGVVCYLFNTSITELMVKSCLEELKYFGVSTDQIFISKVPGSLEIPVVLLHLIKSKKFDALITFGSVVRGETTHYDTVASESANGISKLSIMYGIPIINGILTVENINQAHERAISKGKSCGSAALQMIKEIKKINSQLMEKK